MPNRQFAKPHQSNISREPNDITLMWASVPYVCLAQIQEEPIAWWRSVSLLGWRCPAIPIRARTKCILFLRENLRLRSEMRPLFFSPAILCWPRAAPLTSYVIQAAPRITISSYFHLQDSRNSSWPRQFPRPTMRLLQRSHLQLPLRMFINSLPALGSFSVESCQS